MDKKFSPNFFHEFVFHNEIVERLSRYKDDKISNTIFFGVNNSGKKTIVNAFLNHIFHTDVMKQTSVHSTDIKISNNTVKVEYLSSPYHFEINLYEFGYYDRNIITDFIQDILSYKNINVGVMKIIVINHFDKISKGAQLSLRRIIEKTCDNGRFILICENISSVDNAILSRFSLVRVPKPSKSDISKYIISKLSNYSIDYDSKLVDDLIISCNNDIYKVNLQLEYIIKHGDINETIDNGNTSYLNTLIPYIEKKDLKSMNMLRDNIYKLLLINIEPPELLKLIILHYMNSDKLSNIQKSEVIRVGGECDIKIHSIDYNIIVLEYFIIRLKKILIMEN